MTSVVAVLFVQVRVAGVQLGEEPFFAGNPAPHRDDHADHENQTTGDPSHAGIVARSGD